MSKSKTKKGDMQVFYKTTRQIIEETDTEKPNQCPLDLAVIPNFMGINLVSVSGVAWQRQGDGQLTSLTIYFIPADKSDREDLDDRQPPGYQGG